MYDAYSFAESMKRKLADHLDSVKIDLETAPQNAISNLQGQVWAYRNALKDVSDLLARLPKEE